MVKGSGFIPGIALFWAGTVIGVSFIATPAKFLAPTLPLEIALDVGRVTFHSFLWVEAGLCAALIISVLADGPRPLSRVAASLAAGAIVAAEVFWLLPLLDVRVDRIMAGDSLPPSSLHSLYVAAEVLKLCLLSYLVWAGWTGQRREARRRDESARQVAP